MGIRTMTLVILTLITIIFAVPCFATLPDDNGAGISADLSYVTGHIVRSDGELRYSGICEHAWISAFVGGRNWTSLDHGYRPGDLETAGYNYRTGLIFGWNYASLRINYYVMKGNLDYQGIWRPEDFWAVDKGAQIAARYEHPSILDTGAGFFAEVEGCAVTKVMKTELGVQYTFKGSILSLKLYGKQRTWYLRGKPVIGGFPFNAVYTVGFEILWEHLGIYAEHSCAHEVYSKVGSIDTTNDPRYIVNNRDNKYNGTIDVIGIRFSYN